MPFHDSGCDNYTQIWVTTSLRGNLACTLSVQTMLEGMHSGVASGIAPSSFRIMRQLLSRVEDESTGRVVPADFHVDVPQSRVQQVNTAAGIYFLHTSSSLPSHLLLLLLLPR